MKKNNKRSFINNANKQANRICSPEEMFLLVKNKISAETSLAFLSAILFGVITHLYLFTNNLPNADGILCGQYHDKHNWDLSIGRWAIQYVDQLGSNFTLPWATGLICLFFLALVSVLMVKLFGLKKKWNIILLSALIVVFPSVTVALSNLYMADDFMISYFLSVLAIYCVISLKKTGVIYGVILIACSMGMYQAYIGVAITLCVIFLILDFLKQEKTLKEIFLQALRFFVTGILGVVLYFIILHTHLSYYNVPLANYRGMDKVGQIEFSQIPALIAQTFQYLIKALFTSDIYYNSPYRIILYIIICTTSIGMVIYQIIRKELYKKRLIIFLLILLLILLPFSLTIMKFLAPQTAVSPLMIPQYALFMILPLILSELPENENIKGNTKKVILQWTAVIACFLLSFSYFLLDNVAYFNLQSQYEKTYAASVRILDRIEQQPGFNHNLRLAVIGSLSGDVNPVTNISANNELKGLELLTMEILPYNNSPSSWYNFIRDYLGVELAGYVYDSEQKQIESSDDFKKMGCFPASDCVKVMNGIIVVKLNAPYN